MSAGGPAPSPMDAAVGCACAASDLCCDGCQPQNEGSACESDAGDSAGCYADLCRAGSCVRDANDSACEIRGACYSHGRLNPDNPCQFCDSTRDRSDWTARTPGGHCDDDSVFCNGIGACGSGAQLGKCIQDPDPCDVASDPCGACKEDGQYCTIRPDCGS